MRREVVGDQLTFVANRNLDTAVVRDPEHVAALADEAWALGATEVCVQGPLPPDAPDRGQLDLLALITGRAPLHVHGFRPAEVADGAARLGLSPREFLEAARDAGLGSVPGTAARILDDDIRARLTGGTDIPAARWIELITTAHEVGLRSTATMVYGHVETPADQVAHLRTLAAIQDRTGGFTEMIAMPIPPEALPAGGFPDVSNVSMAPTLTPPARPAPSTPSRGCCCTAGSRTCRPPGPSSVRGSPRPSCAGVPTTSAGCCSTASSTRPPAPRRAGR